MPYIDTAYGAIWALRRGSGAPPLVAVHGAGGTSRHWGYQLRGLADRTTVYALDLPGHGRSAGPQHESIAAGAAWVLAWLDRQAIARAVLMGHSMGGAIVQTIALDQPERVAGLVLVGTGARLRVHPAILTGIPAAWEPTTRQITEWSYAPDAAPALLAAATAELRRTSPAVLLADYQACDRFDRMAEIERIVAPTLVIVGAEDRMTPPKYAEFLARRLPDAQLVVVPGAGHNVMIEQPARTNDAIRAFWPRIALL